MFRAACISLAVLTASSFSAATALPAQSIGPLSMDDIRQFRRDGRAPKDVVVIVQRRGIRFEVDAGNRRALRSLGFRKSMIAQIKATAEEHGEVPPEKDVTPQPEPPPGGITPEENAKHAAYATRVQRIHATSGLNVGVVPSMNVTLIADKNTVAKYMPLVKKIEVMIHKNFPARLGKGPDRRSTYLVLLRKNVDYQRWVSALFGVMNREGIEGYDQNALKAALQAAASMPAGMSIINTNMTRDATERVIAFNLGFLYMQGVSDQRAPAGLMTGFGSTVEAIVTGQPTSMLGVANYAETHLPQASGNRWTGIVQQRFALRTINTIEQIFTYSVGAMQEANYAEAWSLTQVLTADPVRYARLIEAVRGGQRTQAAIEGIYGLSDEKMVETWGQAVGFRAPADERD